MLKKPLIFFTILTVCYCQSNYNTSIHKRKPHYDPYYHLLYGGGILYYLTFILIKIKIAFVIGTIFTFIIFAGKVFALIKYADIMKSNSESKEHHEAEKIYIQAPSHGHDHGPPLYSGPMKSFSSPYSSPHSSGITVDKLPPNAEIAGGPYYDSPSPNAYGRNYANRDANSNNLYRYYDLFKKILYKVNLTEMAFKGMKLKSEDCRKRFVCTADYSSKYISILSTALEMLRDEIYDKYKSNATIASLDDCNRMYPNCRDINILQIMNL